MSKSLPRLLNGSLRPSPDGRDKVTLGHGSLPGALPFGSQAAQEGGERPRWPPAAPTGIFPAPPFQINRIQLIVAALGRSPPPPPYSSLSGPSLPSPFHSNDKGPDQPPPARPQAPALPRHTAHCLAPSTGPGPCPRCPSTLHGAVQQPTAGTSQGGVALPAPKEEEEEIPAA